MQIGECSAIVTGGASGLGLATARELSRAGAGVIIVDLAHSAAEAALSSIGNGARFAQADVTSEAEVAAAIALASSLAPLRIVVNCAGIATAARVLGRHGVLPLLDFERVVRINLIGTFNVLRLAAEAIATTEPLGEPDIQGGAERGVIVNTASVAAFDGQIGQAAYSASKGGVAALTLPMARELARELIRVVAIAPGIFDTPMLAALPEPARLSLGAQVPHPARLGRPEEFAALVRHIVENPMINGETIRLDGAIRMQPR